MTDGSTGSDDSRTASSRSRKWILGAAVLGVGIALVLAYFFGLPRFAESMARSRLSGLEKQFDIDVEFEELETVGFSGVVVRELRVRDRIAERQVASVGEVRVAVSPYHALFLRPVLGDVRIRRARLKVHRNAEGRVNLVEILRRRRSSSESSASSDSSAGGGPGLLRYFGGAWPDVDVRDARIDFSTASSASAWPISRLGTERLELDGGDTGELETSVDVRSTSAWGRWQFPETFDVRATLRRPLRTTTAEVDFDRPFEMVGLPRAPFVRVGLESVGIGEERTLRAENLTLAVQAGGEPTDVGAVDAVEVGLEAWPSLGELPNLRSFRLRSPTLVAEVDRRHGSGFNDLRHLLLAPHAAAVADRSRHIAESLAEDDAPDSPDPPDGEETEASQGPGLVERIRRTARRTVLAARAPERIDIEDATVRLVDHRRMNLVDPARTPTLQSGTFKIDHDPEEGAVSLEAGFQAGSGDTTDRGRVSADFDIDYTDSEVAGAASIDELDLAWLSQMVGARLARRCRGGTLDAKFSSKSAGGDSYEFEGFFKLSDAAFHLAGIAKDPISDLDAGYEFSGRLAPDAPLPELDHLERVELVPRDSRPGWAQPPDAGVVRPDGGDAAAPLAKAEIPQTGRLEISEGRAHLNGVSADATFGVYGFDGVSRLPTRLDLDFSLEKTPVQNLFDAVPGAIRGPLRGTEMVGTFAWDLSVEIPLHNAGDMDWRSEPELRRFALQNLPDEVDVRNLKNGFTHVVEDPTIDWKRRIVIPPMQPAPATWLTEHAELDLEEIDGRRRRRQWPPLPTAAQLGPTVSEKVLDLPDVWTTEAALEQSASKPWKPRQPIAAVRPFEVPAGRRPVEWARDRVREQTNLGLEGWLDRERSQVAPVDSAIQFRGDRRRFGAPSTEGDGGPSVDSGPDDTERRSSRTGTSVRSEGDGETRGDEDESKESTTGGLLESAESAFEAATAPTGEAPRPDPPPLDPTIFVRHQKRAKLHPYGRYVYVPLHHVTPWLTRAIMTTEDNSFFEHDGFNWMALKESVEDNIEAGGFVRGASTISMQLVKNLYLSFDKVLARKLREVFLVWLMESVVDIPKSRILELYFNVIEFGPGIFGVHDAAVHYFGKRPDELTLTEAVWLVSVVPNPKEYHRYYDRGQIDDAWFDGMMTYVEIMKRRDRATEDDVERARNNRPAFYKAAPGQPLLRPPGWDPESPDGLDEPSRDVPREVVRDFARPFAPEYGTRW